MLIGIATGGLTTLLFGGIGIFMLFKYFREKENATESQNWSSTLGKIQKSYMKHDFNHETGSTLYYPSVKYSYQSLGSEYLGNRINFGGSTGYSSRRKANEILAQYSPEKNVTVYFNPQNPEESVLERKMGAGGIVFLIVGILFSLVAFCTLCFGSLSILLTLFGL